MIKRFMTLITTFAVVLPIQTWALHTPTPFISVKQSDITTKQSQGATYVAVYDYVAADEDEVSFNEGDLIINVTIIDDGWAEGKVKRTGHYGMFPLNYAEKN